MVEIIVRKTILLERFPQKFRIEDVYIGVVDLTKKEIINALKAREKFNRRRGKKIRISKKSITKHFTRQFERIDRYVINTERRHAELDAIFLQAKNNYEKGRMSRATFYRIQKSYRRYSEK